MCSGGVGDVRGGGGDVAGQGMVPVLAGGRKCQPHWTRVAELQRSQGSSPLNSVWGSASESQLQTIPFVGGNFWRLWISTKMLRAG